MTQIIFLSKKKSANVRKSQAQETRITKQKKTREDKHKK